MKAAVALHTKTGHLKSITFTMGAKKPMTYDAMVVGFALQLANFMLINELTSDDDLMASVRLVQDALSSVSIQERTHDNRI